MATKPGYYIIAGWVSRAVLYENGTEIRNLPIQTDMQNGRKWIRPSDEADLVYPAKVVNTPSGQRYAYGGLTFVWPMVNLSPKMVRYLQETYFTPSGSVRSFFERSWSNKLTVQTFNRASGNWETYKTYARFADLSSEAEMSAGGFTNLKITFTAIAPAKLGPDITLTATYDNSYYEGIEGQITVAINNIGDDPTFGLNTTLDWEVPEEIEFLQVNVSALTGATVSYSINNGLNYGSLPLDPTSVTNVRVLLGTEIGIGASTPQMVFKVRPRFGEISFTSTFSASTPGSSNTAVRTKTINSFSPSLLSPEIWLDAASQVLTVGGIPATNGDLVEKWVDAYDLQFTQASEVLRPTYRTGLLNGAAGVEFNGASNSLTTGPSHPDVGSTNNTVFAVLSPSVVNSDTFQIILKSGAGSASSIWAYKSNVGSKNNMGIRKSDGTDLEFFQVPLGNPQVLAYSANSDGTYAVYRNGTFLENLSSVGSNMRLTNSATSIGGNENGSDTYSGAIHEILVFNSLLSSFNIQIVSDYLKEKYGI